MDLPESADVTRPSAPKEPAADITGLTGKLPPRNLEIGDEVARGGMGAVLYAKDLNIGRSVAMKVVLSSGDASTESLMRFVEEAQVTGQLEHPGIVPIYDLGTDEDGQPFYTMKLVKGVTLKEVLTDIKDGKADVIARYPLAQLLTIFQKVCDAVAFAHSKGVVHRDLKPENIMIGEFGEVLVMDWGLAKVLVSDGTSKTKGKPVVKSARTVAAAGSDVYVTMDGTIMGSPQFMAPEQADGRVDLIDARTDVFALGGVLYNILALQAPFAGATLETVLENVRRGEIQPVPETAALPHLPGGKVPESLAAVTLKAMKGARMDRYQSVKEFQADITAFQGGYATTAENAGFGKQLLLFLNRNKAAAIGVAAVLVVGVAFGAKALFEGYRAEKALAELKKTAPKMFRLAESEAGVQRFDSAMEQLDGALALDPGLLPAYWKRAWILIAQDKPDKAAAAIRLAKEKDPTNAAALGAVLPVIEDLARTPVGRERWTAARTQTVLDHLTKMGALAESIALTSRVQLNINKEERLRIIREQMKRWNPGGGGPEVLRTGEIIISNLPNSLESIDPLRGLPIDGMTVPQHTKSIEPLRGMKLQWLNVYGCQQLTDFTPIRGMPLRWLILANTHFDDLTLLDGMPLTHLEVWACPKVSDLSFLRGMKLEHLSAGRSAITDLSPLRGMPLNLLTCDNTKVKNLSPLAGCPLQLLGADWCFIDDLAPLRGMASLETLRIIHNRITDLSPLRNLPIKELSIYGNPINDLTPLLDLPKLEKLRVSEDWGQKLEPLRRHPSLKMIAITDHAYKPAAEFWQEYDAKKKP